MSRTVAALAASLVLCSGLVAGRTAAQTMTDPNLVVTALSTAGLDTPTSMAFVALNDILVLEKNTGRVRRVLNGFLQGNHVLDLAVANDSERGLLGIAVQPGAPARVFLYVTESSVDGGAPLANRILRYDWDAVNALLINRQLVLDLPVTSGPNHDGGVILLDASNRLYAVIGDLNRNGQLQNNPGGAAPDNTSVILRMTTSGAAAAGNPFTPYCSVTTTTTCSTDANCPAGQTCRTNVARYYAYGVRNSFGLALDPSTGALWDTENGPGDYDEVNRVDAGFNSGWNPLMGPDSRDPQGLGDLWNLPGSGVTYSDPEFSWVTTVAPTAILFPVGTTWGSAYNGTALVGDANLGNIYGFPLNPGRTGFTLTGGLADLVADSVAERNQVRIGQGFGAITDIEKGPDNHVYVVTIFPAGLYRIAGPEPVELQSFTLE